MTKSATATPQIDLATLSGEVARLRQRLAEAERAAADPRAAQVETLRAELCERQAWLVAIEEAEADAHRRQQAEAELTEANQEVAFTKSEIVRLRAEYSALPALIQRAEFAFGQALKAASVAKQNLERIQQ